MDRDVRTMHGGAVGLVSAIEAVVGVLADMRPLRRERDRLMGRWTAGVADAEDLREYQMARLRLMMLDSANRGVRQPLRTTEVLEARERLAFHAMVDRTDPFPEPQPS
ncbi:hypothetical protein [Pseudonocardia endophytica]|uniref:Uncharacterized protein n=1 Tax=Pseudonocardia endophytica TaxID=401976 RepID=A0A4R1HJS6_PSEEN|nr:hypothetical protein [Pseudonocardia endophytica]TCK20755.1 hypothetical protein EV378_4718 [Pseudonocardia endophytica]